MLGETRWQRFLSVMGIALFVLVFLLDCLVE